MHEIRLLMNSSFLLLFLSLSINDLVLMNSYTPEVIIMYLMKMILEYYFFSLNKTIIFLRNIFEKMSQIMREVLINLSQLV